MAQRMQFVIFDLDGNILQVGTAQNRRMGRAMARRMGGLVRFLKTSDPLPKPDIQRMERRGVIDRPDLVEHQEAIAWRSLRQLRDDLLAQSDYTQMPDFPGDARAWKKYRQKLRDLPKSIKDPKNIVWPKRPNEN